MEFLGLFLYLWKIQNSKPKIKTHADSLRFFHSPPGNFTYFSINPVHAMSTIPLGIPCPQPPFLIFLWNSPFPSRHTE